MTLRVAINGFGRIGRNFMRCWLSRGAYTNIEVVGINVTSDPKTNAHLLKYDSVLGALEDVDIKYTDDTFIINNKTIKCFSDRNILNLPWKDWGVEVRRLDLGIGDFPIQWIIDTFGLFVSALDLTAGIVAAFLIIGLSLLFKYTKMGLGLRAVADDPGAASSIGIPLNNIMLLVWTAAGVVALVAGMMWGARAGVQFALVDLALKALPVLIIGGFSSIPGAIIGGLIIGATEKVLEVYIGPYFGGAIEGWAPYVLAIFFLLYRPEGLFGEKIIRRV